MSEDLTGDLMELLGEDGYFRLCEAFAGLRLYIPGDPTRSELPAAIGLDSADKLADRYPGSYIQVPLGRDIRALRYRDAGETNREIARRLGMTEGGVVQLFSRLRLQKPGRVKSKKDPRQLDLF